MSAQDYTRKIEECRKHLNSLKKDITYRSEQVKLNEPTYAIDAEIRGQFVQVDEELALQRQMLDNFTNNSKEYNLMPRQLEKRRNAFQANVEERDRLHRIYNQALALRVPNTVAAKAADDLDKFNAQYNKKLTKQQLLLIKQKQQKEQDQAIDDLIGAVKTMKNGGKQINKELEVQEQLLDDLQAGIDQNTEKMSKVRRNLMKLLQSSSYTCLVLIILLLIAGIVCNLIFWKKTN